MLKNEAGGDEKRVFFFYLALVSIGSYLAEMLQNPFTVLVSKFRPEARKYYCHKQQ